MKRFKNILLVCDEQGIHPGVIGRAVWLAKSNNARITVVDAVEAAPGELARLFGSISRGDGQAVEREVLEYHRARLAKIAAPIRSEGIETTEVVLQGVPFVEIIRKVLRDGHDVLMKGVAGNAKGRSLLFASTDLHLLRKCPCPVWIMKKTRRQHYARVLAAIDPEAADDTQQALSTLVMDLATSLSDADKSELHVINTWQLLYEDALRHNAFAKTPKAEIDMLVEEKRKHSENLINEFLSTYRTRGARFQLHLVKGIAQDVIPGFADSRRVELIVMGTVGRTGIRGLIIGNTAEAILNQVRCSVLAVKPPGFETPVR